ncbi:synapsin-like [Drosophila hydei]|uniref:Synapsin-like n=1 Tax=Drosophila hydei TaxID=7224 RepID=A0A6J1M5E7_DROHY|nr:synapsin-like [Drosophila hydei]
MGAASNTTSSSSSISSSSISSRINRNGNNIKSPPPPAGPPPPPPNVTTNANINTNTNSSSVSASAYRSSFSSSLSKDKTSYGNYDSTSSIETITRMDTNTTNTAAIATGAGASEASGITAITTGAVGTANAITSSASNNDWRSAIGIRSASVYSAPAAVTTAALPGDTSGYDSNSLASQAGYNNPSDLPSYTRPSYSRSESNASKQSDLDIIFGDGKTTTSSPGNGKYTRSGGSISDADMIFGGPPSNYKTDRFGAAKSMSMSSSGVGASSNSYKIYEGIQNAAFSDFSDTGSVSSVNSTSRRWNAKPEEEDELDLK